LGEAREIADNPGNFVAQPVASNRVPSRIDALCCLNFNASAARGRAICEPTRGLELDQNGRKGRQLPFFPQKGGNAMPTDVAITVTVIVVIFVGFAAALAWADAYSNRAPK
jgi:hypothetical protein